MIKTKDLLNFLKKEKIEFFSGVPDSVLKSTSSFLEKNKLNHHVTANEGSAVAMAIGYHLATKKIACAYMQNSGLGNALNPLISISHQRVYSIPLMLMIGWRGSPGIADEPQHKVKGAITTNILKLLNIKYCILNNKKDFIKLKKLIKFSRSNNVPIAFLIKKNILLSDNKKLKKIKVNSNIKRKDVIENLLDLVKKDSKLIATTGFTSRELHQIRILKKNNNGDDFYMVGGMGHASMVSLGISIKTNKEVICLDGDGSFLMHLGSTVNIGQKKRKNFKHILFNNFSHESVGGQTTNIDKVDIKKLVDAVRYNKYFILNKKKEIKNVLKSFLKQKGPSLLEVKIQQGSIDNLKRPQNLLSIKKEFTKKF